MPPPKKLSRYPAEYRQLGEAALSTGEVTIPSDKPASLRVYLQSYFRACEREGDSTFADCLIVSITENSVIVRLREKSMHVGELSAALSAINQPTIQNDAERTALELLDSLVKRGE